MKKAIVMLVIASVFMVSQPAKAQTPLLLKWASDMWTGIQIASDALSAAMIQEVPYIPERIHQVVMKGMVGMP